MIINLFIGIMNFVFSGLAIYKMHSVIFYKTRRVVNLVALFYRRVLAPSGRHYSIISNNFKQI